jgi:hypothetical protein
MFWEVESPNGLAEIASILLEHTGTEGAPGLAFDNFSPSSVPQAVPTTTFWSLLLLCICMSTAGFVGTHCFKGEA